MRKTLCKLRLVLHLFRGMVIAAVCFPRGSAQRRQALIQAWTLTMLRLCGVRLVVHHNAARLDGHVLVVGNHVSWIDIYVINAWRPTPFVAKAEVRGWPVIGWLAMQLETVFIRREKRSEAKRITHELAQRLSDGGAVCVFPEGTTSDGAGLLPFHANLFEAAIVAGCPVQPICLMYEDKHGRQAQGPAYIGDMSLGESLDKLLIEGPFIAHLYIGAPIMPAGMSRRELAARAQVAVAAALTEMQADIAPFIAVGTSTSARSGGEHAAQKDAVSHH